MEYRKFDNVIVARIDKDEEISEQLRVIAIKENIKLASVQALGAINDFTDDGKTGYAGRNGNRDCN